MAVVSEHVLVISNMELKKYFKEKKESMKDSNLLYRRSYQQEIYLINLWPKIASVEVEWRSNNLITLLEKYFSNFSRARCKQSFQ